MGLMQRPTFIEIIISVVLEKKYDDNNKLILNSVARITADDVRDRNRRTCRRVYKEKKSSVYIVSGL
jgi:hypothetical protein